MRISYYCVELILSLLVLVTYGGSLTTGDMDRLRVLLGSTETPGFGNLAYDSILDKVVSFLELEDIQSTDNTVGSGSVGVGNTIGSGSVGVGTTIGSGSVGVGSTIGSGSVGVGSTIGSGSVGVGTTIGSGSVGVGTTIGSGSVGVGTTIGSGSVGVGTTIGSGSVGVGNTIGSGSVGVGNTIGSGSVGVGNTIGSGSVGVGNTIGSGSVGVGNTIGSGSVGVGNTIGSGSVGVGNTIGSGSVGVGNTIGSGSVGVGNTIGSGSVGVGNTIASGSVGVGTTIGSGSVGVGNTIAGGSVSTTEKAKEDAENGWSATKTFGNNLITGKRVSGHEPGRRRSAPCECPDHYPTGDSLSYDCESRRINLIYTALANATEVPDAETEMAVQPLVLDLRQAYAALQSLHLDLANRIANAEANTSAATNSAILITLKEILNEETLMAESVNNAWMSLIDANIITSVSQSGAVEIFRNVTTSLVAFLTRAQAMEDSLSYRNLQTVVGIVNDRFTRMLFNLNAGFAQVKSVLVSLDANSQMTSDSTSDLGNALVDSADSLTSKIGDYNQTGQTLEGNLGMNFASTLEKLSSTWDAQRANGFLTLNQHFQAKLADMTNATNGAISDQASSVTALTAATTNATSAALSAVRANYFSARPIRFASFDAVDNSLAGQVANFSAAYVARASNDSNANIRSTAPIEPMNSVLAETVRNSATRLYSSKAAFANAANAAKDAVANSLADDKSRGILLHAKTLTNSAVDATGTSFAESMNNAYDTETEKSLDQAHSAATSANAVSASLGQLSFRSNNLIGGASDQVTALADGSMSSVMANMNTGLVFQPADKNAYWNEMKKNLTQTASLTAIAASALVANTSGWAAASNVSSLGLGLGQTAQTSIDQIQSFIGDGNQLHGAAAMGASDTDGLVRSAVGNAAAHVANVEDTFSQMLTSKWNLLQSHSVALGTVDPGTTAADLKKIQGNFDLLSDRQQRQSSSAADQLTSSGNSVAQTGTSAMTSLAENANSLSDSTTNGQSGVNAAAAALLGTGASMVSAQSKALSTESTKQLSAIDHVSISGQEKFRAMAASIETLNNQINSFLTGKATGDLYNDIQSLPVLVQRVLMGIEGFDDQRGSIVEGARNVSDFFEDTVKNMNFVALNTSAVNSLSLLNTTFNQSATNLVSDVQAQFADLVEAYVNAHTGVYGTVSSVAASDQNNDTTANTTALDALLSLNGDIPAQAPIPNPAVWTVDPAYASSINAVTLAGQDAQTVSDLMKVLGGTSADLVQNVRDFGADGTTDAAFVLDQANANASLSATVQGKSILLANNQAQSISADAIATVSDYELNAQANIAAKQNQASYVYDSVVAGKADLETAMGSLVANFSSTQANTTSAVASDTASQAVRTNMVRQLMHGLLNAYQAYLTSQASEFNNDDAERDTYMHSLALSTENQLEAVDSSMKANDLAQKLAELQTDHTVNTTQVEDAMTRLQNEVSDWSNSTLDSIQDIQTVTIPPTDLGQIDALVQQLAIAAIQSIQESGKTVPDRLNQIASR